MHHHFIIERLIGKINKMKCNHEKIMDKWIKDAIWNDELLEKLIKEMGTPEVRKK
jgi:hypothetical protein